MSAAHDAHGGSAHSHDAPTAHDAHNAFDGEPATTLPAGEPRTPGWLPVLGLALFVSAGVYFLVSGDHAEGAAQKLAPMELPAPAAPPVAQAGADSIQKMSPQQIAELRKKIEDARAKIPPPSNPPPSNQGQPAHP